MSRRTRLLMMKILSFDPGGSTGWAKYEDISGTSAFTCGTFGPEEHHLDLEEFILDEYKVCAQARIPMYVVCESFEYRNDLDKAELISKEYIGIVKLVRWHCYDLRLVFQTAAMGKIRDDRPKRKGSFVQKRHLEKLGLWIPGREARHAMDAYGHLVYYVLHSGNPDVARLRTQMLEAGWRML